MPGYEIRRDRIEPLWDRVDRNRLELVVFLSLFFVAATSLLSAVVMFAVAVVYGVALLGMVESGVPISSALATAGLLPWVVAGTALVVLVYMVWALTRGAKWFARKFGAEFVPRGELMESKYALKDMAIASGFELAPALYVIDTSNVNAFVFGRRGQRPIVGITAGLAARLDPDEQRAVFANLMARLRAGDTMWASAVTALMTPLWWVRDRRMRDDELVLVDGDTLVSEQSTVPQASDALGLLPLFAIVTAFVVVAEFVAFGHRRSQLQHAEVADAEGMLLLKDPHSMLSALEKAVRFNNYVPTAGPGMSQLFYCWTGEDSTDDEEDPENQRITRLREVLGVEGMAPVVSAANVPAMLPPLAPRFEE